MKRVIGLGTFIYLAAVAWLAIMDLSAKWLGGRYEVPQVMLFRAIFAYLPVLVLYIVEKRRDEALSMRSVRPGMQAVRGLFVAATIATFFWSLSRLPLADATAISLAGPIFMVVFGAMFAGEKGSPRRWSAVVLGCVGVLIIVQPRGDASLSPATVATISAVFYALAATWTRKLGRYDPSVVTALWTNNILVLVAMAGVAFTGWMPILPSDIPLFIVMGLAGGISNILFIAAFRASEVSLVAALDYTIFLWSVLFGMLFFDEIPKSWVWFGVAVVIAAGLYATLEHREKSVAPAE